MIQSVSSDVERVKQLEAELRLARCANAETLALLDMLQSMAPVGFGFVDRALRMLRINETLAMINGLSVEEHLGQPLCTIIPDLWPFLEPVYGKVLDSGAAVCDLEVDGVTAADKSRTHHWLLSLYPVFVQGEAIGIAIVVVDITERTDAEDARRRLARIVEQSDEAIFNCTPDGVVLSWNAAAERLFGYTAQEIIGQSVVVLAPPGLVAEQRQLGVRISRCGSPERLETTRRRKDGRLIDVLVTASPSTDYKGAVVGVSVIVQDLTERNAVQQELKANQRRLAEAQRIAEIGSFELDLVTGELISSDEFNRILGLDPALPASRDLFLRRVRPDDLPLLARDWQRSIEQGVPFDLHYRIVRPDAEQRWVHTRMVPEVAANGTVVRLAGTIGDETRQIEATRQRREAENRFETSFEQAGIGAAILGLDGIPTRVNAAACAILGRTPEELADRSWDEYQHPDDPPVREAALAAGAPRRDTYADERRFIRPDGSIVWTLLNVTRVRADWGEPEYFLAQLQDITERKQMQDDLAHQVLHDTLTGLANGALLTDRLTHALARTRRRDWQLGVIFLDIDEFKVVNDSFGHGTGDALLRQVADRITAAIRASDTVARFAGDEFVIVCDDATTQEVEQTAERILAALRPAYSIGNREVNVTASAGIAIADEGSTPESLLRDSDDALYLAKGLGRDRIELFDETLRAKAEQRLFTTTALRQALARQELSVQYQPVIDLSSGAMVSAEALLRWNHPERGLVSPQEFIPIAEESGLIVPIGAWALEQACEQLSRWQRTDPLMSVAVNLSVRQFLAPGILDQIAGILERTRIRPESLCLELTESVFMHDVEFFGGMLAGLKDLGVKLSLDDFGTGYSSLSYLSRFPFDAVKIDQAFIRGLGVNPHDTALVAAILSMAEALRLSVTAEGIEDQSQLAALIKMRCQQGQGFHLSPPIPGEALDQLVATSHRWQLFPAPPPAPQLSSPTAFTRSAGA